jgi:NADH-quinone oxidoreductase subunit E
MLTDKEKHEIMEEVKISPFPAVACLDALKIVQQHRGWISDESVKDIAEFLNISAEQVEGVATYYSRIYRSPVGRHVILLCDSITCMIMGYDSLYRYLSEKLGIQFGETTSDKRFTLLPITCLGDCDHAPSMMIDNELYGTVTPESIDLLLEKYS